jgi:hypothetical protein
MLMIPPFAVVIIIIMLPNQAIASTPFAVVRGLLKPFEV